MTTAFHFFSELTIFIYYFSQFNPNFNIPAIIHRWNSTIQPNIVIPRRYRWYWRYSPIGTNWFSADRDLPVQQQQHHRQMKILFGLPIKKLSPSIKMPTIFRSFATSSAIPPSLRDWAKALHSFFFSMLDPQLFIFLSENCFSSPVSTCPGRRTQVSELSRSHFRDHLRLVCCCCFLFRVFVFMRLPPVLSARGHPHPTSDSTRPGPFHSSWLPLADCSLTDGQRLLVGGPRFYGWLMHVKWYHSRL